MINIWAQSTLENIIFNKEIKKYMQSQLALVITVTGQYECKSESKGGNEPREVANMFSLAEQEAGGVVIAIHS